MAAIALVLVLGTSALAQTTQPEASEKSPQAADDVKAAETSTAPTQGIDACRREVEDTAGFVVDGFAKPMTRVVYGNPPADIAATVRQLAAESRERLDKAAARLNDDKLAAADDERWELTDRVEMLRAFVDIFEALGTDDDSEAAQERILKACNGIALYLDDRNPAVVESAQFWQGVAYRRVKKPERTIQTLRPLLTSPENTTIGLLGRLEHCRALGDAKQHAAALALTMKLDARLDAWFSKADADTRVRAGESVRVVRVELLTQWAEVLDREGNAKAAENARRDAKIAQGKTEWPPKPERLLALDKAIGGLTAWKTLAPKEPSNAH